MYWIDNGTGVTTMPEIPPTASSVPMWFTEGGPGEEPTIPGAAEWNMLQAELLSVLYEADMEPAKAELNQIAKAVRAIAQGEVEASGFLPSTGYKPRPDSLRGDVPTIQNKDMDTCLPGEFGLYETSSCAHSPAGAGNWFYCETKSINADGSLIQLAWPYAGVGVLAWRNWRKSTEDWDSNWREAYDTGNKPTPADIGASPDDHAHNAVDVQAASYRCNFAASLGVVRSISGETLPSTPGVWAVNNSTWTPHNYGSLLVTTNRSDESVTPGTDTFIHYIFVSHRAARMYAATNVNGSFSGWNAIYDTGHKPIPSEIGAAPTTHTHSAAQGNADIIAGSWNAVGATVMARRTGSAACAPGERVAGSALLISSASASAGGALPGTWQCQGIAVANSGYVEPQVTTWIRVA
ncbi:hypothetical protein [Aeromonas enteropelogenes]|uniref:hypothetical protein n=1 Tax=Aeromonas enteropelogenes TaxID=29489 RepID=UPI003BA37E0B